MTREEEIITEFKAASNCQCTDNEKSLILAAMELADEHPAKPQLSARDRGFIDEIIYALEVLEDEKNLYFGEEKEFLKKIRKL